MFTSVQQIEKLIHEGRFLEARKRAELVLKDTKDERMQQLLALSMAKSGAPKAAMILLEPLYKEHPDDPETSGILGSIYKELFKETRISRYAALSRDTYLGNYRLTGSYYTGINAASMYAMSGSMSKAKEIARGLISALNPSSSDAWELATLGEAFLLIREKERAVEPYVRCRYLIGSDWGKINSIYNQLWLLNHFIPVSTQIMTTFSPPAVAAFVGHMIDRPERTMQRFPSSIQTQIKDAITGAIQSVNAKIGYCSLACGGDILFAEAMSENGGEVNISLPFTEQDFLETSVAFAGDDWVKRFNGLKKRFPPNYVTSEAYHRNDDLFSFQSQIIFGSAIQRARMLHTSPHLITVFADVDVFKHTGGTYDTLRFWPGEENRININPLNYMGPARTSQPVADVRPSGTVSLPGLENRQVRYLVSLWIENGNIEQYNRFQYHVSRKIQNLQTREIDQQENSIVIAFKTIEEAVELAWGILKISSAAAMVKVTLHAGPVLVKEETPAISGAVVDTVRLIGDLSIVGKVYSSLQFASILSLHTSAFALEYAGIVSSSAGDVTVFQVNRHADAFDLA